MITYLVKSELKNNILQITLNNPKYQNTLSETMIKQLDDKLQQGSRDNSVKVIILSSTGPVFCAGHNLKDLNSKRAESDRGKSYYEKIFKNCSTLMMNITNNPKPIIAAIDGIATAAGCQLIASCDLAYSSDKARFATPGVNIGLFCSTPMVPLSRNVSKKAAMEMLLTGDLIDADKAQQIGLVNGVFTSDKLMQKVSEVAQKISSKSMKTLKIGKKAFYKQREMSLKDAYDFTSAVMTENMLNSESEEGIRAFLEKRKPVWDN